MAISINNKTGAISGVDSLSDSSSGNWVPTGVVQMYAMNTAPSGWLLCDGSAVSRTTYANLFAAIVPSKGAVTITVASPGVVTLSSHGFQTGDMIYLTTTGSLPTGLSANTIYFVINVTSSTFRLATSAANAAASTAINTSGSQSGTHTLRYCPYGLGNASTTFNVPDMRGRCPMGAGTGSGLTARVLGTNYGAETITLSTTEIPSHSHTNTVSGGSTGTESADHTHTPTVDGTALGRAVHGFSAIGGGYSGILIIRGNDSGSQATTGGRSAAHTHTFTPTISNANAGSGGSHANVPPTITMSYIIKI
jgi:microcystin-dependent protein